MKVIANLASTVLLLKISSDAATLSWDPSVAYPSSVSHSSSAKNVAIAPRVPGYPACTTLKRFLRMSALALKNLRVQ